MGLTGHIRSHTGHTEAHPGESDVPPPSSEPLFSRKPQSTDLNRSWCRGYPERQQTGYFPESRDVSVTGRNTSVLVITRPKDPPEDVPYPVTGGRLRSLVENHYILPRSPLGHSVVTQGGVVRRLSSRGDVRWVSHDLYRREKVKKGFLSFFFSFPQLFRVLGPLRRPATVVLLGRSHLRADPRLPKSLFPVSLSSRHSGRGHDCTQRVWGSRS